MMRANFFIVMDRESSTSTLKLPTFNGSSLRDYKRWGLQVTEVALSSRSLRLVANHIGHIINPRLYPARAMPAAFTEPAPAYPTGSGADGGLTPSVLIYGGEKTIKFRLILQSFGGETHTPV